MPKMPSTGKMPPKPLSAYQQRVAQAQRAQHDANRAQQQAFEGSLRSNFDYANQQAYEDGIRALMQAQTQSQAYTPSVPLTRTKEEITAQLEARYDELVEQSQKRQTACDKCKWLHNSRQCKQPLVKGYENTPPWNYECNPEGLAKLCGPEKALWEEKIVLTWWQRLLLWLGKTIEGDVL